VARRFVGQPLTAAWIHAVAQAARDAVEPEEHLRVPAVYRKELTETLATRALVRCAERAGAAA
jgi:CO/xanthine dehydrogenase FAD-binding subunit